MEAINILSLTVEGLRAELSEAGLDTNGTKAELQIRLLEFAQVLRNPNEQNNEPNNEQNNEQNNEPNNEQNNEQNNDLVNPNNRQIELNNGSVRGDDDDVSVYSERAPSIVSNATFTLRDVEDSVSHFTGSDSVDVIHWITEFEEIALTVNWDALHKYIYAKQLIKGAAKLFIRSLTNVNTWEGLKISLIEEFGHVMSSAEVHRALRNRKKHNKESLIEYLYVLLELGNPIKLDHASIIEYFIEGIPDSRINKTILYEAKNIKELKEKIRVYEKIRDGRQTQNRTLTETNTSASKEENEQRGTSKKCFKCGKEGHLAKDCRNELLCFKCKNKGHYSYQCPGYNTVEIKKERVNVIGDAPNVMKGCGMIFVDTTCENYKFKALLDTGSQYCLMRKDTLMKISPNIKLMDDKLCLVGVGEGVLTTLGSFEAKVKIKNIELKLHFHVVKEKDIAYPALIGVGIVEQVNIIIKGDQVDLIEKKKQEKIDDRVCSSEVSGVTEKGSIEDKTTFQLLQEFEGLCCTVWIDGDTEIEVDVNHLNIEEANQIRSLVQSYKPQKVEKSPIEMKITLVDDYPVSHTPRKASWLDRQIIKEQVEKWINEGIITNSFSEYAAPVVLVLKKDGTKRLCCDYRRLNKKIVRDNFPMVLIDEVLERLQGSKMFITLDLMNGFFHVPVEVNSRKYTSFVTYEGQYEFLFVPFGICNSPAVFYRIDTVDGVIILQFL